MTSHYRCELKEMGRRATSHVLMAGMLIGLVIGEDAWGGIKFISQERSVRVEGVIRDTASNEVVEQMDLMEADAIVDPSELPRFEGGVMVMPMVGDAGVTASAIQTSFAFSGFGGFFSADGSADVKIDTAEGFELTGFAESRFELGFAVEEPGFYRFNGNWEVDEETTTTVDVRLVDVLEPERVFDELVVLEIGREYQVVATISGTTDGAPVSGSYEIDLSGPIFIPPPLPGDATGDGVVDGADYLVWRENLGRNDGVMYTDGDFDMNGVVDGFDYLFWQERYGIGVVDEGPLPGVVGVPEPGLGMMVLVGVGIVCTGRR